MNKIAKTIGYITPRFFHGIHLSYYLGILEGIRKFNMNFICYSGSMNTVDSFENTYQANRIFELLSTDKLDGLVCWTTGLFQENPYLDTEVLLKKLQNIPFIGIGQPVMNFPCIQVDSYKSIYLIMSHLIEVHNFKKIAFIRGPEYHIPVNERYYFYLDILKKYNIPVNEKLITPSGKFDNLTGVKGVQYFLDEMKLKPGIDIEAIISVSDLISVGAVEELKRRGIKVPQDIAVCGSNNKEESMEITPQLTTIDHQYHELGKAAIKGLMSIFNGEVPPKITYIQPKLIVRESCGCRSSAYINKTEITVSKDYKDKIDLKDPESSKKVFINELNSFTENYPESLYSKKNTPELINTLIDDIYQRSEGRFITALNRILDETLSSNSQVNIWQYIITKLHEMIISIFSRTDIIMKAETVFHEARITIFQKLEQSIVIEKLKFHRQQAIFPAITSEIVTTFDLSKLIKIIEKELPKLGIPACYLAVYLDPNKPADRSKLIMAYDEKGHIDLSKYNCIINSSSLFPEGIIDENKRFELIINPLFFQERQIGYIIFKEGNIDASIYFAIRNYISSALQGALLVESINERADELVKAKNEIEETNKKLQILAQTDPLTKLNNRRYFMEYIKLEFERATRYNSNLSLIILDLDHFKSVNDTYGHQTGDEVLQKTAQLLHSFTRTTDIVARYGGEEFCILMPQTLIKNAYFVAEKLRIEISKIFYTSGKQKFNVTSSFGVTQLKSTDQNFTDFLKRADDALYTAKEKGRNRVEYIDN